MSKTFVNVRNVWIIYEIKKILKKLKMIITTI